MGLTSLLGLPAKILMIGIMLSAMVGAVYFAVREHDARVANAAKASMDLAASKAIIDQQALDAAKISATLEQETAVSNARAEQLATVRKQINAAPRTMACASSPAIRAALSGLHNDPGSPGAVQKPGAAGKHAVVPGSAGRS
ncbi:MAG TPA: hypothetical protein VGP33_17200 [Chloroflexota bacterium]|nr:hypothetical protein [Chloroflexota bacterium]